jgi:hypothetical protein
MAFADVNQARQVLIMFIDEIPNARARVYAATEFSW